MHPILTVSLFQAPIIEGRVLSSDSVTSDAALSAIRTHLARSQRQRQRHMTESSDDSGYDHQGRDAFENCLDNKQVG